jgi:hypothetical protein
MDDTDRIIEFIGEFAIVERLSSRGHRYVVWEHMPRTQDLIRECVVYLYPSKADANESRKEGGTGFLVSMRSETGRAFTYVVTNRHVVEDGARFIRINYRDRTKGHDVIEGEWVYHEIPNKPKEKGDDLAACEFFQSIAEYGFIPVQHREFVTRQLMEDWNIGIGEELFMVGRFLNHEGKTRNLPVLRFGSIAMMNDEPIEVEGHGQEAFLAEIRTVPGYSGSPVFVHVPKNRLDDPAVAARANENERKWALSRGGIEKFLGVEYSRLNGERVTVKLLNNIEHTVYLPTGMSAVIPAWKVDELLNQRKFQMQRRKIDHPSTSDDSPIELTSSKSRRQKTTPKVGEPIDIPVLSERQFDRDLNKAIHRKKD